VTQNTDELCLHADEPLERYGRCEKKETDHFRSVEKRRFDVSQPIVINRISRLVFTRLKAFSLQILGQKVKRSKFKVTLE